MRATLVLLPLALLAAVPPAGAVDPPAGYRLEHYRAAVPDHLPGAATIDAAEARRLRDEAGAALIDVTPLTLGRAGPLKDRWVIKVPHETIAGADWLPNVGLGVLDARLEAWFRAHLGRLTDGRPDRPLVFFCRADCWMSWNAAKRAVAWGHPAVFWFPGGTDDWFGDLPTLIEATPHPLE